MPQRNLAFDIEADNLNRKVTKIHCIVAQDLDTGEVFQFEPHQIEDGLQLLVDAERLWAHNGIAYDIPVLAEIYPNKPVDPQKCFDTLILSRLLLSDILDRDFRQKPPNMPVRLYGRHSLESWGYRLGVLKSEFGKNLNGDWSTYSREMLDYCTQDVEALVALVHFFEPKMEKYAKSIKIEHEVAQIMTWQEYCGFPFDVDGAHDLVNQLSTELEGLTDKMRNAFTFVDAGEFTPKVNNASRGYVKGAPMCKLTEFSPTSRDHIAWAFTTHRGWDPVETTETGKPKVDEAILSELPYPEAKPLARILELQKALGLLSQGQNAWLRLVTPEKRLHHSCVLNTATGRNAHMRPNLGQVPHGEEFRKLFHPGEGRVMVGSDCSGLELRCLAHYLARYDGGAFGEEVINGDIHQTMADISGVDRRTQKTITYALIYGAGDFKLGISAGACKADAKKRGSELRYRLLRGIPGFKDLVDAVQEKAKTGVLLGLDRRPIRLRKPHAALNYLLQSAGAVICKSWVIRSTELADEALITYHPLEFVHDEQAWSVAADDAEKVPLVMAMAIDDVAHDLKLRVPLAVDTKIGNNWAEVH